VAKQVNSVEVKGSDGGLVALVAIVGIVAMGLAVVGIAAMFFAFALSMSFLAALAFTARTVLQQRGAKAAVLWEYRQSHPSVYGADGPYWPGEPTGPALAYLAQQRRRADSTLRALLIGTGREEPTDG
jgi:hypothetical protein